ncbi:MAG: YidC/Oxa1 family membrane protein insertase [Erysipelotrichaceae bacterium]
MKKLFKNKKLLLASGVILFLAGCSTTVISLDTPYTDMFKNNNGWFELLFIYPLAQALNWLTPFIGVFMAIVAVTLLVKLLTLAFTVKSTVASQKMQMLNPELQAIQAKYAGKKDNDSKMKQGQEMQALYSKNGVNPFGSILVLFIQFPVIIAMYQAVQRSSAVKTASIFGYELINSPKNAFTDGNILFLAIFILMAVSQFASMKLPLYLAKRREKKTSHPNDAKPKGPNMEVMMYSSLVMIVFLAFSWPTAMSLYWLVSSVAQIIQTLYIQNKYIDIKKV